MFVSSGSHNLTENLTEDTEEQSDSLPTLQEQGSFRMWLVFCHYHVICWYVVYFIVSGY